MNPTQIRLITILEIKSFVSQNWGGMCLHQNLQDCVMKESIRCESVSVDMDVISESAIL